MNMIGLIHDPIEILHIMSIVSHVTHTLSVSKSGHNQEPHLYMLQWSLLSSSSFSLSLSFLSHYPSQMMTSLESLK